MSKGAGDRDGDRDGNRDGNRAMYLGISLVTGWRQEGVVDGHFTDLLVLFSGHSTIDPSSKLAIRVVTTTFTATDGVFQRTRAVCRPNPLQFTLASLFIFIDDRVSRRTTTVILQVSTLQIPALILKSTACGSRPRPALGTVKINFLTTTTSTQHKKQYCRSKNWPKRDSLHHNLQEKMLWVQNPETAIE